LEFEILEGKHLQLQEVFIFAPISKYIVFTNHKYTYHRKLNAPEIKPEYQIKITNRLAALENLNTDEDVNRAWETIKENIKASAKKSLGLHELKQHKPWFDQKCLGFLDQKKQVKMQWIQDTSRSNIDNPNNVRRVASRHFRNKKRHI
jgi:hypothetical protein